MISRVPALRNLSLPAPPPPQFRQPSHSCRRQNAQLFVNHVPFMAKSRAFIPHNHPKTPKPPVQIPSAPATLPPCSDPSLIRTMLPSAPIPTRYPAREGRPNAHFPTPRTSLPQTRSSARQYRSNRRQKPSLGPHSAPPRAQCPTGISGNERKRAGNRPFRPYHHAITSGYA